MKVSLIREVKTPTRGTTGSAGIDFYVPNSLKGIGVSGKCEIRSFNGNQHIAIAPHGDALIPSGVKVQVPEGWALIAFNKSGVAVKHGLSVGACVIDEDYQGEIHLHLTNRTQSEIIVNAGDKIIQFVLLPYSKEGITVVPLEELYETTTARGEGGFGSTGGK